MFKTHLLGRPVIRVSGAENVRTILLGEHRIVRSQWPQSAHILLGSHTLLGAVGEPHRQRRKVSQNQSGAVGTSAPRFFRHLLWARPGLSLRGTLRTWPGPLGPVPYLPRLRCLRPGLGLKGPFASDLL